MSIIPKIQKLLALSKSSNEHEAQAAATKAHELLAEHALSMAEVTAHDTSPVETIGEFTASSRHSSPWVRQLWGATSRAYFCTYFYYTHQHKTHHTVIGTELNSYRKPLCVSQMPSLMTGVSGRVFVKVLSAVWHSVCVICVKNHPLPLKMLLTFLPFTHKTIKLWKRIKQSTILTSLVQKTASATPVTRGMSQGLLPLTQFHLTTS